MRQLSRPGIMLLVAIGTSGSACECVDRRYLDAAGSPGSSGSETSGSEGVTALSGEAATDATSEGEVDASAFLGGFHSENWLVPLGMEVENPGGVILANLEIRADGTASMTMEQCSEAHGTVEFAWLWEARPGPRLEFSPGPGEESLRFFGFTELDSLTAFLVEPCAFQFEADGVQIVSDTFRPGRACWVNRCEPAWRIEIGYCEGEEPAECE